MDEPSKKDVGESGVAGLDMPNLDSKGVESFKDEITKIAIRQMHASSDFKKPLLEKWRKFENIYAGRVEKKLRIPFQVALPVFPGMVDTLCASFDEPIELEYYPTHPSQYFKAQKIQGAWNTEKDSDDADARWDYKSRIDKKLAIMHGRGILKKWAASSPNYKSFLENADPLYFHCQPNGGGILEKHLFAGQEDIFKTEDDLKRGVEDGVYDAKQVKILLDRSKEGKYQEEIGDQIQQKMQRFAALRLNARDNNYVGINVFNLCEWTMTYKGKRWYLLFDPLLNTWVRVELLKDLFSLDLMPWDSWATHEDNKVFWSKAYGDDLYPIADAVTTLFNQELTNREKRNLGARAYDKDMFNDVAKLDSAQYRADALVPADTKGGTRKISEGIYRFDTAELNGTIDLLGWIRKTTGSDTGITDIAQGAAMDSQKKVGVAYQEQAQVAKRIGHKSQSYSECWGRIGGVRYVQGLKDHMSEKMAIQTMGDRGLEWDEITRDDLDYVGKLGVRVISSTARKEEAVKKKQGRVEAIKLLIERKSQNVNSQMIDAGILRDIGEYDDDEIKLWLDTNNYASKDSVARAHIAIQKMISNKKPDFNFRADTVFMTIIRDYALDHRKKLGMEKFNEMMQFFLDHAKQAHGNAIDGAKQRGRQNARASMAANAGVPVKGGKQGAPQAQPQPSPMQPPQAMPVQ